MFSFYPSMLLCHGSICFLSCLRRLVIFNNKKEIFLSCWEMMVKQQPVMILGAFNTVIAKSCTWARLHVLLLGSWFQNWLWHLLTSWHQCLVTPQSRKQQTTLCQPELQRLLRWQKFNCLCWNQARKQGQLSCPLKKSILAHHRCSSSTWRSRRKFLQWALVPSCT